jgi:opacity protein-like surface antigen
MRTIYIKSRRVIVIISVVFSISYSSLFCQTENQVIQTNPKRFRYYFNGGLGLYTPINQAKLLAKNGIVYSFQAQINYKDSYFIRLAFDQYNISYSNNTIINGLNIKINEKVQTLNIGVDYGYAFHLSKRFSPIVYLGIGYASMEAPTVKYDNTSNVVDVSIVKKAFVSFRGGVGGEYEFNKYFIISAEVQYLSIPFKTDIGNQQLNGLNFQISFKTPLQ